MKHWRLLLFLLVFTAWGFDLHRFKKKLDEPAGTALPLQSQVDVIAVLTGGQRRLKEAVSFLEQGRGRYLFISGIEPGSELNDIFQANHIEASATRYRDRIYLDDQSRSTFENAVEIRDVIRRLEAKTLLVVTSTYHMRRALELIRAELNRAPILQVEIFASPVMSPNFEPETWWQSFAGWKILFSEYFKSKASFFNL